MLHVHVYSSEVCVENDGTQQYNSLQHTCIITARQPSIHSATRLVILLYTVPVCRQQMELSQTQPFMISQAHMKNITYMYMYVHFLHVHICMYVLHTHGRQRNYTSFPPLATVTRTYCTCTCTCIRVHLLSHTHSPDGTALSLHTHRSLSCRCTRQDGSVHRGQSGYRLYNISTILHVQVHTCRPRLQKGASTR